MDISSIIGIIVGLLVLSVGVMLAGVGLLPYLSLSSIFIVFGASFCAMLLGSSIKYIRGFRRYFRIIFHIPKWNIGGKISMLVNLSDRARREGLLALEDTIETLEDTFTQQGIQLVVDGTDPDVIKNILFSDLEKMQERHFVVHKIFDEWAKIAPAFGLIGTIIGLIAMLGNIGGDISIIGRGLQTALITTLYGAVLANLILIPMRVKLENRNEEEVLMREIIIEGVLSIQSGDNPRILFEKLLAYLPDDQRETVRRRMGNTFSYGS